jgi:hypothetical protein
MIDADTECPPELPPAIFRGIKDYVLTRREHGSFIMAVLCNDLKGAIGQADEHSLAAIRDIVRFIYNETPSQCQGSREAVRAWMAGES